MKDRFQVAVEAAGGEYPLYLDWGGTHDRVTWERLGCPARDTDVNAVCDTCASIEWTVGELESGVCPDCWG